MLWSSAVLASVVSLTVAIAILVKQPRRPLYTRFALLGAALFFWHTGSLFSETGQPMAHIQVGASLLIPPSILLFFSELLRDHSARVRRWTRSAFLLSGTLFLLNLLPDLRELLVMRIPISVYVISSGVLVLRLLWEHEREASSETERRRLRYLLVAGGITLVLASGELVPGSGLLAAIGHIATTLYIYFLYQSIVARRLINMVEMMAKAAELGVLASAFTAIYALLALWVDRPAVGFFNTLLASFVILILYGQLRPWIETTTAKLMFRQHYELRLIAQRLVRTLRTTISIEKMCDRTLDAFTKTGITSEAALYLLHEDGTTFSLVGHRGDQSEQAPSLEQHPPLLQELRRESRPLLLEDLNYRYEDLPALITQGDASYQRELERISESIDAMHAVGATVLVPMISDHRMLGILSLGTSQATQSGQGYSTDDITSLLSVAEACAIVVENSQEYEKRRERDRLVEIGEMATGMAHEIRNPLGAIKGAAQCLNPEQLPPDTNEFIDVIVEEVDRLNGVVSQFLDYARPYRGNPTPVDINEVVSATLRLMEHGTKPDDVEFTRDLALDLPRVNLDPEQLKQILFNLAKNAIESMPEGGRLTVRTAVTHDANDTEHHRIDRRLENAQVLIRLTDTGSGIPTTDLGRIFVPFFTTKAKGTGLGLAISQRIVENCGGRLEVASQLGKGTTFTLKFPALTEAQTKTLTPPP